ncbi:NAD(P)/FAD-dependent oxidoreductase [Taibaiella koreensis]|uniref:NAD(P)/FAD-dependent oxidoreductase n=1 Tax=Taibaiella koreensis TaxID=1268548 RepID=UPI000E59E0A5|nr:NAD(P)/FAD-dependent oxidoreductase [Taibaiella koreensis]
MNGKLDYEVIIVGGSYAGLSAAMALGRALRRVLVIDAGEPCNRNTPQSHNFITHDGTPPAVISQIARSQVRFYQTVQWQEGRVSTLLKTADGFEAVLEGGERYTARKVLLATGMKDLLPDIPGMAECWGISVLHCPYCHGYEVRGRETAIWANGAMALEMGKLIAHWTSRLQLLTDGSSTIPEADKAALEANGIKVIEKRISRLSQQAGHLDGILFDDGSRLDLEVLYARVPLQQQLDVAGQLGCILTPAGLIQVDEMRQTSVPGLYAAGDNSIQARSVAAAAGAGNFAGAAINRELIEEHFLATGTFG